MIALICAPLCLEQRRVGAEHLHVERALEARQRFVDRVFGRLRVVEVMPGKTASFFWTACDQLVLRAVAAMPFAVRLESDVELGIEESRWIGAVRRRARAPRRRRSLRERLAASRESAERSCDDSSNEIVYGIVARTQSAPSSSLGMNSPPRRKRDEQGDAKAGRAIRSPSRECVQTPIEAASRSGPRIHSNARCVRSLHALRRPNSAQHGNHGERQQQRADQREDRRVGHWLGTASRRTRERVDRKKSGDDHRSRVHDRTIDLRRRVEDHVANAVRRAVSPRELAVDVLDHHDRAIDEDAEVDRADRQQVRRNVPEIETDERDQQRRAES